MTIGAWSGCVCASQWKRRCAVVESSLCIASRVTSKARLAVVSVPSDITMFAIHTRLVVLMAINASELTVIRTVFMAIGTTVPHSFVVFS
jgi:hypothetical protein